jgi:hypothetical protein
VVFSSKAYPYPVLSPYSDDFRASKNFDPLIEFDQLPSGEFQVRATLTVEQEAHLPPSLERLLVEGKATWAMNVYCSATLSRQVIQLGAERCCVLPAGSVLGTVEVTLLLVNRGASELVVQDPSEVASDFAGVPSFRLLIGDPLAISRTETFTVDLEGRQSNLLLKLSFSDVVPNGTYEISTDSNPITVFVDESIRTQVLTMYQTPNLRPGFFQSIVKDAFVFGLQALSRGDGYGDLPWKEGLLVRLSQIDESVPDHADFQELNRIAQRLVFNAGLGKVGPHA